MTIEQPPIQPKVYPWVVGHRDYLASVRVTSQVETVRTRLEAWLVTDQGKTPEHSKALADLGARTYRHYLVEIERLSAGGWGSKIITAAERQEGPGQ
jgi:hypothetical protein